MSEYQSLKDDISSILSHSRNHGGATEKAGTTPLTLSRLTYRHDHMFPSQDDLIEFGIEYGLCFHRAVALILKNEWEMTLGEEVYSHGAADGDKSVSFLAEARDGTDRTPSFNPDTAAIFAALERHGGLAGRAGYGAAEFDTMAQQMVLAYLHVTKSYGAEIERFIRTEKSRMDMLKDSTPEEQQEFWTARCRWARTQEELDSLHSHCEKRRLQNAETRRQYLAAFGKYEVDLQEATYRYCDIKRRKMLKESNPHLSQEELDEEVAAFEEQHHRELTGLKSAVALAPILARPLRGGSANDYDELQKYRLRARKLLRKLRAKTHEDHLRHDPAYAKLTEKQKEELHGMLLQALQISLEEIGFPEGCIEHDMRSVPGLEAALQRVDAILENAGIDTRIDLVIRGKTLREQLEWLQEATRSLERRIESARAELHALATDMEPERMRQVLASPEQHERIQQAMQKKANEYIEKTDSIEHDIETLFRQDGRRAA